MNYLIQVAKQRPMLRITAEVILTFCCAAPLVFGVNLRRAVADKLSGTTGTPLNSARLFGTLNVVAL